MEMEAIISFCSRIHIGKKICELEISVFNNLIKVHLICSHVNVAPVFQPEKLKEYVINSPAGVVKNMLSVCLQKKSKNVLSVCLQEKSDLYIFYNQLM